MTPYYEDTSVQVFSGDCLDVLPELPDNSVDCVVTDPPYGLEFMGKEWDGPKLWREYVTEADQAYVSDGRTAPKFQTSRPSYAAGLPFQRWSQQWAAECLRILRPGGHLLAFGGTRTSHRLACAIEDAGFEIRDSIAWLYGSGFPKSLAVDKAVDSHLWRQWLAAHPEEAAALAAILDPDEYEAAELELRRGAGFEREVTGSYAVTRDLARNGRIGDEAISPVPVVGAELDITAPATPEAARWQGWGTALKPAHEPIVVARKPLSGTVAGNVLRWGTGALNIDACRIGDGEGVVTFDRASREGHQVYNSSYGTVTGVKPSGQGRWPANVVLDSSQAAALDQMSGELTSGDLKPHANTSDAEYTQVHVDYREVNRAGDSGGASRYFYTAKASSDERITHNGTAHPTVKPLSLMRWLVRLVTPPRVTVCDTCENRRRDSTTPDGNGEVLRTVRHPLPGEGQSEAAAVLLEGVRQRGDAGEAPRPAVPDVRPDVRARPDGDQSPPVLFEDLRDPVDDQEPLVNQGLRDKRAGLQDALPARSPDGDEERLRSGAPGRSGRGPGSDADSGRSSAPPQRGQARQPAGEPRGAAEARPRQDPEATPQADQLPSLRRGDQGLGTCAQCGGHLSERPGLVVDPFAGSGTTVEAALLEGFRCIAIEREADYLPLITQRINRRRDPIAYIAAAGEDLGLFAVDGEAS